MEKIIERLKKKKKLKKKKLEDQEIEEHGTHPYHEEYVKEGIIKK